MQEIRSRRILSIPKKFRESLQTTIVRNNIIAVIAISFAIVGGLWGVGNLLSQQEQEDLPQVEGVLLVAERSTFNGTNPDIHVVADVPKKLVVLNKDAVTHDLKIDGNEGKILEVNTAPLRGEQHFNAAILAYEPGTYEYYCSYHPEMRGRIIASQ